ncbi:lantibiotic biosynthesis protein [Adhaeribacter aerolatus]|uniref:Lantibiotic biosynthesis protein n=1 Tax=Adhaeribacter aerolatus TaxID=670289 RepID=A0A512AT64_9BACT|nr:thiopeptide-type bacteriocin biosynthesis protein [Adhaeribacter aerolatus]GEO02909.1 lantibiotic biosynthesis protein [Adhaeribacter aerolatus]
MNTNSLSGQSWLGAYLYYNEPWEDFLRQAVAPFVQKILAEGLAEQFFFIRYWEKGPHIRLRFKGDPEVLENQVKPRIIQYFSNYFTMHPSCRIDPPWLAAVPEAQQWYPNNSIQFIPYEPETERYGGDSGIFISESQFQASSEAVLGALTENNQWDYSRALGIAIQMHLGFAFAAGLDLPATINFFSGVFRNWLPRAYFPPPQQLSAEEIKTRQEEVIKAFRNTYHKQKNMLLPLFTQIWQGLENNTVFEQHWFNTWLEQTQVINAAFRQAQQDNQVILPQWAAGLTSENISTQQLQRWAIYDSYIHMTNNRLGILNRDEGYLGFLIKEGLAEMALQAV